MRMNVMTVQSKVADLLFKLRISHAFGLLHSKSKSEFPFRDNGLRLLSTEYLIQKRGVSKSNPINERKAYTTAYIIRIGLPNVPLKKK
jgi:hypothetical protein